MHERLLIQKKKKKNNRSQFQITKNENPRFERDEIEKGRPNQSMIQQDILDQKEKKQR